MFNQLMERRNAGVLAALFLVLVFFVPRNCLADTTKRNTDLHFHSSFEQQVFLNLDHSQNIDILKLFLMSDAEIADAEYEIVRLALRMLVNKYRTNKYNKFGEASRVKRIIKDVNENLLETYEKTAGYYPLFDIGWYQPVTQSMLYALLFSELNIPFEIRQVGYYCWLIVFPDEKNAFVIETDEHAGESVFFDGHFKADYVGLLRDQQLISNEEYEGTSLDLLFDRYYRVTESIDMVQLAAAQYHRLAMVSVAGNKHIDGFRLMEKAYVLHPNNVNQNVCVLLLKRMIEKTSVTDPKYASYLAKLMRFQNAGVSTEQLTDMFSTLTHEQLLIAGDVELYDASYNKIIKQISDAALFADISFLYYSERGKALMDDNQYDAAEPFITEAFSLQPQNPAVKTMFFGIMLAKMESLKTGEDAYALDKFADYFETITGYKNRFEHLNSIHGFRKAWLFFCLTLMDQYYQFNDAKNGEKYRRVFENEYPVALDGYEGISQGIVDAYYTAAVFYKKNNNSAAGIAIAKKGLEYVPHSPQLLELLGELK